MNPLLEKTYTDFFSTSPYISKIVSVDVECTGFGNDARIIEIGAAGFTYDGVRASYIEFSSFVNPHMSIPQKVVDITGITDEMVRDAPEDIVVFSQFDQWLQGSQTILMHNAKFDSRILRHNYCRVGMNFVPHERSVRCTLEQAKAAKLPLTSMKLGEVAKHFGYVNEHAHRALHDAIAALYIHARLSL